MMPSFANWLTASYAQLLSGTSERGPAAATSVAPEVLAALAPGATVDVELAVVAGVVAATVSASAFATVVLRIPRIARTPIVCEILRIRLVKSLASKVMCAPAGTTAEKPLPIAPVHVVVERRL